jgi:anti-sigma regulatory factor (Ser/Thr protein kinase)
MNSHVGDLYLLKGCTDTMSKTIFMDFVITADKFFVPGEASVILKKTLKLLGISPEIIKKAIVSMYEAEINAAIHAGGGTLNIEINSRKIIIKVKDSGPGIACLDMAMKEGYSTISDRLRKEGLGAGMGLANIKKYADNLQITSVIKAGTEVTIEVNLR